MLHRFAFLSRFGPTSASTFREDFFFLALLLEKSDLGLGFSMKFFFFPFAKSSSTSFLVGVLVNLLGCLFATIFKNKNCSVRI